MPALESWRPPPKSSCEAPITRVWGPSSQWGPGAELLVREGGQNPLKAETLLAFRRLMEVANLPTFLKFKNAKSQIGLEFVLFLQKMKFNRPQYITDYFT